MIYGQAGAPAEVIVSNAPPGLVGTISVEIYDPSTGATIVSATTAGITEPRPGTYVTSLTSPIAGSFAVRWTIAGESAEELLTVTDAPVVPPVPPAGRVATRDIRPDRDDVGALLRARTKDDSGNELGTFTDQTRPTGTEVDLLIDQGQADVRTELPDDVDADLSARVRSLMALATVLRIEVAYFPDQVATGRSAFEQYRTLYLDGLRSLAQAQQANQPGGPTRIHNLTLTTFNATEAPLPGPLVN